MSAIKTGSFALVFDFEFIIRKKKIVAEDFRFSLLLLCSKENPIIVSSRYVLMGIC